MMESEYSLATNLQEASQELAQEMTELYYRRNPELEEQYGDKGREKSHDDAIQHIRYLEQAIQINSSGLFSLYLDWAQKIPNQQGFPENGLIDKINYLKQAIETKLPADEAQILAAFIDESLESLESHRNRSKTYLQSGEPLVEEARTYLELLLDGKRKKAAGLVEELAEEQPIKDIYEQVFQKTQYEVGVLWQNNEISVAQEHYCTAATQLIMSRLYPQIFAMGKSDKKLMACSVADELHEIGIRMVSDFFEMEGWDTHYLGANMPDWELITSLKEYKADILAISVTLPLHIEKTAKLIKKIREDEWAGESKIMVGGYPFRIVPDLWEKIGADASADSAQEAIETANNLL